MKIIIAKQNKEECKIEIIYKNELTDTLEQHIVFNYEVDNITGALSTRMTQEFLEDILSLINSNI